AVRETPVERFILISSSEVYGTAERAPMDEEHPLNPRSPYAATKAGADRLAYSYFVTYGLPIVIVRPFNNYGPRQHPEKVIPRFVTQALSDEPPTLAEHVAERPGQVDRHVGSTEKVRRLCGWSARTSFEEGLARTVAWYRQNEAWWRGIERSRTRASVSSS